MSKSKVAEQVFAIDPEKVITVPSVTFHKSGRYVRMKANDIFSADVVREIASRTESKEEAGPGAWLRTKEFYGAEGEEGSSTGQRA